MKESLLATVWRRARTVGYQLDCLINAAFFPDAQPNQSVSENAEEHQYTTKWGCFLCRALGIFVAANHCEHVRAGDPMPTLDAIRAAAAMGLFLGVIYGVIDGAIILVRHFV